MRSEAPVVWLIRSRGGAPRRVRYGYAKPPMRPDEFAYRVVLPPAVPEPHGHAQVVRLGTVRLRRSQRPTRNGEVA